MRCGRLDQMHRPALSGTIGHQVMVVERKALGHDRPGDKIYRNVDRREVDDSRRDVGHFVWNHPARSDGQRTFRMRYCFSTNRMTTARYDGKLNGFGDVELLQCPGGVDQTIERKHLSSYTCQRAIASALKRVERPKINNLIRQTVCLFKAAEQPVEMSGVGRRNGKAAVSQLCKFVATSNQRDAAAGFSRPGKNICSQACAVAKNQPLGLRIPLLVGKRRPLPGRSQKPVVV